MSVQAEQHVKHVVNQNTSIQAGEILAYIPIFCGKIFVLTALGTILNRISCYRGYEYRKDEAYRQRESRRCSS